MEAAMSQQFFLFVFEFLFNFFFFYVIDLISVFFIEFFYIKTFEFGSGKPLILHTMEAAKITAACEECINKAMVAQTSIPSN